ncbi:MAG: CoA transferase [Pararhodobacter sp.]|nr:CoA transferase [Pararhodobacter sp.]
MTDSKTDAPLRDIRVLDLSTVVAGPFGSDILAALGAEVIRITPAPEALRPPRAAGDPVGEADGFHYALERNKKAVALDLKSAAGKAEFLRLVSESDVVYDNFRPGVTARLGIDHAALSAINPKVICCSISGYGAAGPWAEVGAYDVTVQALSGAMSITGSNDSAGMPCRWGVPIGDITGAFYAVVGILAALNERARTGQGQALDISLLDGQLALNTYRVPQAFGAGVEFGAAQPRRGGAGTVPYGPFLCADGAWLVIGVASKFWQRFCAALGIEPLADDPRFATLAQRQLHQAELEALLEPRFLARNAGDWQERLIAAGVPVGRVNTISEAFGHPQAQARAMAVPLEDAPGITVAGSPLRFVDEPPARFAPPQCAGPDKPALSPRTEQAAQADAVAPTAQALATQKGPLNGLVVLELCGDEPSGTFGTQILADLGAAVIKIERPPSDTRSGQPAELPVTPALAYFYGLNRNKRSVCLNLKTPKGRDALLRLVARADAIYDNYKPGVMNRLGLDSASLRRANPALVSVSVSGFGHSGPWSNLPAYDATIQALGGGMSITGTGEPGAMPVRWGNPIGGIGGAFYAVIGLLAGLHRRRTGGAPAALDIALLDAQLAMHAYRVAPALAGHDYPATQRRGGSGALPYGPFRCADGRWFVLGIAGQFWARAAMLLGHPEWVADPRFGTQADRQANEAALNALVEAAMIERIADDWQKLFVGAGLPGAAVRTIPEAFSHPHVALRDMLVSFDHPLGRRLQVAGSPVKLSRHPFAGFRHAPALGEDTRTILTGLGGLSELDLQALHASGAAWWAEKGENYNRPAVV